MVEPNPITRAQAERAPRLEELDWRDIREPGAYLHVSTGLLMRRFEAESGGAPLGYEPSAPLPMVKLSADPSAPLETLRAIAVWYGYLVQF